MNDIAEIIRTDPSVRQTFCDVASQRDPALGQQLTQSLRLLDTVARTGPQGVHGQFSVTLAREEKKAIQRLTDRGFEKEKAVVAYLVSDKNEERATDYLVNNNSVDSNNAKAKTLAIGKLINSNPSFRLGLNEFIAQSNPALAQQMKGNPALFEAALQSVGDGTETPNKPEVLENIGELQRAAPPPSGYRIFSSTTSPFPDAHQLGQPPCYDLDGSPLYFGSAAFSNSVHPCKLGPHLSPFPSVPYDCKEIAHHGRFDILPFDPNLMELVHTSHGRIPAKRTPIEGGYEEYGSKLYHAVAVVNGNRVPGKTGEHLGACNVSFRGAEILVKEYEILCWR